MNAGFFALALVAALNPKLLAIDLLLIENRRPRVMFLVAGKSATATQIIAVVLFVIIEFALIIPYAFLEFRPEAITAPHRRGQAGTLGRRAVTSRETRVPAALVITGDDEAGS